MSNIVMAILIISLALALASFGIYADSATTTANARAARVAGALERAVTSVQASINEDGVVPSARSDFSTVFADRFTQVGGSNGDALSMTYAVVSGKAYACASVAANNSGWSDAFARVVAQRPAWFISGACGVASTAVGGIRFISAGI